MSGQTADVTPHTTPQSPGSGRELEFLKTDPVESMHLSHMYIDFGESSVNTDNIGYIIQFFQNICFKTYSNVYIWAESCARAFRASESWQITRLKSAHET